MIINYSLIEEDFVWFNFYHMWHLPSARKKSWDFRLRAALTPPVLTAAMVAIIFRFPDTAPAAIALAIGFVLGVYTFVTYPKTYDRKLYKAFKAFLEDAGFEGLTGLPLSELTTSD